LPGQNRVTSAPGVGFVWVSHGQKVRISPLTPQYSYKADGSEKKKTKGKKTINKEKNKKKKEQKKETKK
jgi:hypothetical protein